MERALEESGGTVTGKKATLLSSQGQKTPKAVGTMVMIIMRPRQSQQRIGVKRKKRAGKRKLATVMTGRRP